MDGKKQTFTLYNLIIYSGIATFICLVTTMVLGITGANIGLHGKMGMATFAFACVHVGLVIYKQMKVRQARKQAMKQEPI